MKSILRKQSALAFGLAAALALVLMPARVGASGWTPLNNTAPNDLNLMLLLPDGTVMCQEGGGNAWYLLSPDSAGHYVNGTWTTLTPMEYTRNYFSSDILPDGRVYVAGGEYGSGSSTAEVYDPKADSKNPWHELNPPANPWTNANYPASTLGDSGHQDEIIDDADSEVLSDSNVIECPVFPKINNGTDIYNPSTNAWSAGPSSLYYLLEATLLKLPDNSLLSADVNSRGSQRYIPSLNKWVMDGNVPVQLGDGSVPDYAPETGPAALLPNGRALFISGTHNASGGFSALYSPSGAETSGTWAAGPYVPGGYVGRDAPCAMMNNGKVLCALSPAGDPSNQYPSPTAFFEYDYTNGPDGTFTPVDGPAGVTGSNGYLQEANPSYYVFLLNLPDGTILSSNYTAELYVYTPDANTNAAVTALEPVISSVTLNPDGSYHLAGTLLNGISEGSTYGDDGQMATNFPIVSLTNGPKVYYARTYHWSSTGVMQTGKTVTTEFELPPAIPNGTYSLAVSANGLKSASVPFTVSIVWVDFNNASSGNGTYANPYNTLAAAVNASASGGMIDIKEAGSSSETLTISKSVSILASKGAAMVGIEAPGAREARVSPEEAASSLPPAQRIPAGHPLGPPGRRLNP